MEKVVEVVQLKRNTNLMQERLTPVNFKSK